MCDEPGASGHMLGGRQQDKTGSLRAPPAPVCQAAPHLRASARAVCTAWTAPSHVPAPTPPVTSLSLLLITCLTYIPLPQEAFPDSLVKVKCPSSVLQRPQLLATEVTCSPVGLHLTQLLEDQAYLWLPAATPEPSTEPGTQASNRCSLHKEPTESHVHDLPACPSPRASVSPYNLHSPCQLCSSPSRILLSHLHAWAYLTWSRRQEGWCSELSIPGLCLSVQAQPGPQECSTEPHPSPVSSSSQPPGSSSCSKSQQGVRAPRPRSRRPRASVPRSLEGPTQVYVYSFE